MRFSVQDSSEILYLDSPGFRRMSEAVLSTGSGIRFKARGASMLPNILDGDMIVVVPTALSELQVGDVVLAECGEQLKLHRIVLIEKEKRLVVTRGDAGRQPDLPADSVLGRVIEIEQAGHRIAFLGRFRTTEHSVRRLARRLRLALAVRLKAVFPSSKSHRGRLH